MDDKTFDQLVDELHKELVNYYGGEWGLETAKMLVEVKRIDRENKEWFARNFIGPVFTWEKPLND